MVPPIYSTASIPGTSLHPAPISATASILPAASLPSVPKGGSSRPRGVVPPAPVPSANLADKGRAAADLETNLLDREPLIQQLADQLLLLPHHVAGLGAWGVGHR
jgi:hypothetical protein